METGELNDRLSQISTQWTMVFQAHGGEVDALVAAQNRLMQRYSGAVYRYLLGAARDPDVAADLAQEFALRFVRGDFRRANPKKGRFRDYVKTALIHLVNDYHRARQAWPKPLAETASPITPPSAGMDTERSFIQSWREDLLDRTWKTLAEANPTYHAVLLLRVEQPDLPSAQIAEQLSGRLGQEFTADGVRKSLERAHKKFAELLVEEVAASLDRPDAHELEAELRELDLLKYCRSALERRKQ
jgi:RNA polymerase sigma factor (sigma-70 family)